MFWFIPQQNQGYKVFRGRPSIPQLLVYHLIITVRKWSCRKVMFLHLSVILFNGGEGMSGKGWLNIDLYG